MKKSLARRQARSLTTPRTLIMTMGGKHQKGHQATYRHTTLSRVQQTLQQLSSFSEQNVRKEISKDFMKISVLSQCTNFSAFLAMTSFWGKYTIDPMASHTTYRRYQIEVEQEIIGLPPSTYDIQYRDIKSILEFLIGHEPFEHHLSYAPVRQFSGTSSDNWIYDEMHTGD